MGRSEDRPPPGSNLGRAWTQLRRDRDRGVSIAKDCVALLNDMNREGEIPVRFELRVDSILVRLANLLGAERTSGSARRIETPETGNPPPPPPTHNLSFFSADQQLVSADSKSD